MNSRASPMRHVVISCILTFVLANHAAAQTMLELVPRESAASIAIRNLDELIERGDKLLNDTAIKVPIRPSQVFAIGTQFIGVNQGFDRKRPAAILLLAPDKDGHANDLQWLEKGLVPVLPFTDADAMAGNFGIAKGAFKPMSIHSTGRKDFVNSYATRMQNHIALSGAEATLKRLHQLKPVTGALDPAQRKLFDDGDVVLHLGKYLWKLDNAGLAKEIASKVRPGDDPKEKEFADLFAAGLNDVDNGFIGVSLKDGIDGHFLATVPKDSKAAFLLSLLRKQRKSSTLHGLPDGNVLFAQASSGDSSN